MRRRTNAADFIWTLEKANALQGWTGDSTATVSTESHNDGIETVVLREADSVGGDPKKFLRLKVAYQP